MSRRACTLLVALCASSAGLASPPPLARPVAARELPAGAEGTGTAKEGVPGFYLKTDVEALIRISSEADLLRRRAELTQLAFGTEEIPRDLRPTRVLTGRSDPAFERLEGAGRVDVLTTVMDHGIDSVVYYIRSETPARKLAIFHQGHGSKHPTTPIHSLLQLGYDVLAMMMPLTGWNSRPVTDIDNVGHVFLSRHRWLMHLRRPLRFFVEPVAASLNHALESKSYDSVVMIGFSGGAWTTTLYSAMDPRVSRSYAIGGTKPLFLWSAIPGETDEVVRGGCDFEQHYPPMLEAANYLEMFVMGASGEGRRQVQIVLAADNAFGGAEHRAYEPAVAARVARLGPGSFRVLIDDSSSVHSLTPEAFRMVAEDLADTP